MGLTNYLMETLIVSTWTSLQLPHGTTDSLYMDLTNNYLMEPLIVST